MSARVYKVDYCLEFDRGEVRVSRWGDGDVTIAIEEDIVQIPKDVVRAVASAMLGQADSGDTFEAPEGASSDK